MIRQAVIMAGGLGTRLRPVTEKIPKPMVDVNGKPFLEYIIFLLKNQGFKDFLFCVGYKNEIIKNHFGDGSQFGINIEYSIERKPLGTGGAILNAKDILDNKFVLIWGDVFCTVDNRLLANLFGKSNKLGLMHVYDNSKGTVAQNNVWIEEDYVKAFYRRETHDLVETKSVDPEILKRLNGVAGGSYVYSKDVINFFPKKENFSIENDVYHKLIAEKELIAHKDNTRFFDIGTFERLNMFKLKNFNI